MTLSADTNNIINKVILENKWRESDLANLKKHLNDFSNDNTIIRMAIPLIYAHWEGYIVSAFKILVCFFNEGLINPLIVRTEILALSRDKIFASTHGKKEFQQITETIINIKKIYERDRLNIDTKSINTKSNLSFKQLNELCNKFCINLDNIEKSDFDYKHTVDTLLQKRNSIAHGENPNISYGDALNFINCIQDLWADFLLDYENYIKSKSYLLP